MMTSAHTKEGANQVFQLFFNVTTNFGQRGTWHNAPPPPKYASVCKTRLVLGPPLRDGTDGDHDGRQWRRDSVGWNMCSWVCQRQVAECRAPHTWDQGRRNPVSYEQCRTSDPLIFRRMHPTKNRLYNTPLAMHCRYLILWSG